MNDEQFEQLRRDLNGLRAQFEAQFQPAEIRPLRFNGAEGKVEHIDQVGLEVSESYGIFNPLAIKAYLAIGSTDANQAAGALPIPAQSGLILPVRIVGHVKVGVDAGELGAETALIWRLKFSTTQAFYLGGI
jgi:hypothetical protein